MSNRASVGREEVGPTAIEHQCEELNVGEELIKNTTASSITLNVPAPTFGRGPTWTTFAPDRSSRNGVPLSTMAERGAAPSSMVVSARRSSAPTCSRVTTPARSGLEANCDHGNQSRSRVSRMRRARSALR